MIPPTPTPTNLPPMTPTYYLPPTPTPPYMMYNPQGQAFLVADQTAPCTAVAPRPPYTKVKPLDLTSTLEETNHRQSVSMAYFTSPFKRFTKFRGTPTRAQFPLRPTPSAQSFRGGGGRRGGDGVESKSWYQQGARWGQWSGGEVDQVNRLPLNLILPGNPVLAPNMPDFHTG
eukprot:GFUD01000355.1.p2 GENE.GFUD01000355.1~~GFUD01000355.1.p2  ORF type:complete len:173 (+),score=34.40 GFUD01000355.1:2-520(+)